MKISGAAVAVLPLILSCCVVPTKAFQWVTTVEPPEVQEQHEQPQISSEQQQLQIETTVQAVSDEAITTSGESVVIDVLSNDIMNDSSSVSITIQKNGKHGVCIDLANGAITYIPDFDYAGYDECQYMVCDDQGNCDSAVVFITVVKALEEESSSSSSSFSWRPPVVEPPESYFNDTAVGESPTISNDVALNLHQCSSGEVSITIELRTDQYGEDTTWELVREYDDGSSVQELSRGPYGINTYDSVQICAPSPSKYIFTIYDAYEDGFCCTYGNGYYKIYLEDRELVHVTHFNANNTNVLKIGFDPTLGMTMRDYEYLHAHNKRRRVWHEQYNVSYVPLQWSPWLAEDSLRWANVLLDDCDSSGIEHEPGVLEGENLAKNHGSGGWGQLYPPENIVRRWVDFEIGWDFPENAHLTQALWRASKYLGCGESVKPWRGGWCRVQVCRYAKSGNCDMGKFILALLQLW